jgi:hypothetical protein
MEIGSSAPGIGGWSTWGRKGCRCQNWLSGNNMCRIEIHNDDDDNDDDDNDWGDDMKLHTYIYIYIYTYQTYVKPKG